MHGGILFHREHQFWKNRKSVHDQTRIGVHDGAESGFMMDQNWCSRSDRICNIRNKKFLSLKIFYL
jgi:hypothetical protein